MKESQESRLLFPFSTVIALGSGREKRAKAPARRCAGVSPLADPAIEWKLGKFITVKL